MFGDGALAFREFVVSEELPLAIVQQAMLEFLRDRTDAVVFGAQAVNAYVDEPRMTQDIDLLSVRAGALVEELREHLAETFHIAVRVRQISERAYRLFQVRQPKNRHLADVRQVDTLPRARNIAGVLILEPAELIAEKVIAYQRRRGQPKSGTDWRDLASLLLKFPDLKTDSGPVRDALTDRGVEGDVVFAWESVVRQELEPGDDEF